jgi:hypothetical protein
LSSRGILLFVEGDTEIEFFRALVQCLLRQHSQSTRNLRIIYRNARGIRNFQNKVLRIFTNQILRDNPGIIFDVVLCYDTDAFEYARKPPVNWRLVEADLKGAGANKVIHIRARHSIEDWFLYDYSGLLRFLRLPQDTSLPGGSGIQKLKSLFKQANKVYVKGSNVKGFIQQLDIDEIIGGISEELSPLIRVLGINVVHKPSRKK